ncbi:hypothetical protein QBC34DRAFT_175328 [Podospora aff. communis PSN243]|uniref:CST complex subunit STN1 n=1 Tax=Podospora aff. communis PSN243 TaxID=3040156 RepID=A0AAV9H3A8_9PEZI|nr:hypothetical protein QBC34DRAFT_175328 [Podospora aff. communis PSN243]
MTSSIGSHEIYPQYCFHLSPTIAKWCHLRCADIVALTTHPGFEGQDLYFHKNHPIKWVRIAGMVVAVDDFGPWRAYTIDDSSGATTECHVNLPKPTANSATPGSGNLAPAAKPSNAAAQQQQQKMELLGGEINVGDIIDVKGTIRVYRQTRQIKAEKIVQLKSTEKEVEFWEKVIALRKDALDKPWVLDEKVVRKCRKEAEGYEGKQARKERRERRERREKEKDSESRTTGATPNRKPEKSAEEQAARKPNARLTGLEKRPKPSKVAIPITGKYSALGL